MIEYFSFKRYLLLLQNGWTALIIASQEGHTETVKCLIDAKASVDMQKEASIGLVIPKFYVNISELINNNVNKTKH